MSGRRRISPWVAAPPAIFLAIALTFFWGLNRQNPDDLPSVLIDKLAPQIVTQPIEGLPTPDNVLLTDGRPKIVNFWASWCGPCRIEHPNMMKLAAEGVPIIGLNYKDEDKNALKFLSDLGNPYTAVGSVEGRDALNWGVYGVPETYVLDGQGRIKLRIAGPITDRALEQDLRPALDALK